MWFYNAVWLNSRKAEKYVEAELLLPANIFSRGALSVLQGGSSFRSVISTMHPALKIDLQSSYHGDKG